MFLLGREPLYSWQKLWAYKHSFSFSWVGSMTVLGERSSRWPLSERNKCSRWHKSMIHPDLVQEGSEALGQCCPHFPRPGSAQSEDWGEWALLHCSSPFPDKSRRGLGRCSLTALRTGWDRRWECPTWLHGSWTEELPHFAPCPLLRPGPWSEEQVGGFAPLLLSLPWLIAPLPSLPFLQTGHCPD